MKKLPESIHRYAKTDVEIVSLKAAGLKSDRVQQAFQWVKSMTNDKDGEDGPDFLDWIIRHHDEAKNLPEFDTFFLFDIRDNQRPVVLATASIVPDDRDVGKFYKIDGWWCGGLNVC